MVQNGNMAESMNIRWTVPNHAESCHQMLICSYSTHQMENVSATQMSSTHVTYVSVVTVVITCIVSYKEASQNKSNCVDHSIETYTQT